MGTSSKYIISCPKCGKSLFKCMQGSQIEVQCPKCQCELIINHSIKGLNVCERRIEYTALKQK